MGGVIGAVSGKFILAATGLLISATVDRHKVNALIDPAAEISQVSGQIADKIDKTTMSHAPGSMLKRRRPITIGIRAETFELDALPVSSTTLPNGIDLVIGRDVLERHVFDLNFRSKQLRVILPYEYKDFTRHMTSVALSNGTAGAWNFSAAVAGGPSKPVSLKLASPHAATFYRTPCSDQSPTLSSGPVTIGVGPTVLYVDEVTSEASESCAPVLAIGLSAFVGRHIVLDLPHRRLWIDNQGSQS
jgi:hypothetical protein